MEQKIKLVNKPWARVVAFVLFILMLPVTFGCFLGIAYGYGETWYDGGEHSFYDSSMCITHVYEDSVSLANGYIYAEQAEIDAGLVEENNSGNGFSWVVKTGNGAVLRDTRTKNAVLVFTGLHFPNAADSSYNDCTMDCYIDLSAAPRSSYNSDYQLWSLLYSLRYAFWYIGIMAAVFSLLLFAFLACAAGHNPVDGEKAFIWQDKIPLDLYLAFCAVLVIVPFSIAVQGGTGSPIFTLLAYGTLLVFWAALLMSLCMTVAARLKAGRWWKNTIIYMILSVCAKFIRTLVTELPLSWKPAVVYCVFMIVNIFGALMLFRASGAIAAFSVLLVILADAAVLTAIVHVSVQLCKLKRAGRALADGDLGYSVDTEKMRYDIKEHGDNLNSISAGISKAVEARMKSERFKTELITNVSHDLKTPLTSIVSYVDLLKKENIESPAAKEYIEVLDRQSARLKKLTEDLVEASKASSGTVAVNSQKLNVAELLQQLAAEYSGRFEMSAVTPIVGIRDEELSICADGRLLWRVFDNLMQNICKYALPGTRAYFDVGLYKGEAIISLKNISANPLNIPVEELMERFKRGDQSRSTEGYGLGLSIAKSLTELQGGKFDIVLDGDLFKAVLTFPAV